MPTIFIKIASYRDTELTKTIISCLNNAKNPRNLSFGIVNQYGAETEKQLKLCKNDNRFRIIEYPWEEARGVGFARAQTDELYRGEDFYLQIDSHMRFERNWDERLIDQWEQTKDEKAIISSYPPAFEYDINGNEEFIPSKPNRLVVHDFNRGFIPVFFGKEIKGSHNSPVLSAYASGGLQFGPGKVCLDVAYNKNICFIGEEIVHSLRLFCHGYNIYSPLDQVASHLYTRSINQKDSHHIWNDFNSNDELRSIYKDMEKKSFREVAGYLDGKIKQGLGGIRGLNEFEDFAGVIFKDKLVHQNTYDMLDLPAATDSHWREDAIRPIRQT